MPTPVADFFKALTNAGFNATDVQNLAMFQNEPDFLGGVEQIARVLARLDVPGLAPPAGEPWCSIHLQMRNLSDLDKAFQEGIKGLPGDVQLAISNVVFQRVGELQQQNQSASTSSKNPKTKEYLKALQALGYAFKFNVCTGEVEVDGKPMIDPTAAEIRQKMRDAGFPQSGVVEDVYLVEAYRNRYHPIKEYLNSLSYDGGHYIDLLSSFVSDRHGAFPAFFKRWLIGSVAKVMAAEQNPMLVLDGPQGIGKSEFVKWLSSPMYEYFYEGPIDPDDKDTYKRLMRKWVWEVSELGATTRRTDREALKAFVTMREVTVRLPYAQYDTRGPAMASLVGTLNSEGGFLNDPTGNRRFLTCSLTDIDWRGYTKAVEPDHVWAEAYALYLAGEPWHLTEAEKKLAGEINEEYELDDPIEGLIKKFFEIDVDQPWWTPSIDILAVLEDPVRGALKGTTKSNSMALSACMTRLGLKKCKRQNQQNQYVNGYLGIRLF
jgi:hypothetical protein